MASLYQPEEEHAASARALSAVPALPQNQIAELQRTGGNQAVVRALERPADASPAATAADEVFDALRWLNDVPRALKALAGHSAEDRAALRSKFREKRHIALADYLYQQLDGADLVRAFALLDSTNAQEPFVALGLALIPTGTRNAEVWRILEGSKHDGLQEIERRYNATFGAGGYRTKGLLTGSLRTDLADELSGWEEEKALAMLDHPLTDAEHLYFLSVAISGTHTDSVVALIQRVWQQGPAEMQKLHQDWKRYVQSPLPGVHNEPWTTMGVSDAMRDELSLEAWGLVKAVLDGYDRLSADPRLLASAEPGSPEHDRIQTALETEQMKVARDTLKAATTGDDWLEGAGTNEDQVFQAISTLRTVHTGRIDRLKSVLADTKDPEQRKALAERLTAAESAWKDEQNTLKTGDELGGAEQERATLLKDGELSDADQIYLASSDGDDDKVVAAVTAAWAAGRIETVLKECRTAKPELANGERPAFTPNLLTRIGSDAWYRVNALVNEGVTDAERGAARLAFEIDQGDCDSDLRKAHDLLAGAPRELAVASAEQYAARISTGSEKPIQQFLDYVAGRYDNSKAVWDLRDLLDPGKTPEEHLARAKGRLEAADTGIADELLGGLHQNYDDLTGEQTQAVTQESLARLEFLVKASAKERAEFAKQLGKPVEQVSAHEYGEFKNRLADSEAVEAAMVEAIATTLELVVSAAITAATGGAAAGLLLASLSSAVAGMLLREVALGDDYDLLSKENAKKLASAVGGAALGAIGGELVKSATALENLGKLGAFVGEATQEAFSQVGSGMVEAAFDNKAPTIESIAAKAVSMVVSMGASGASGVIKFDIQDASPIADQVRARFGAAIASSTINALGAKASELTAAGGMGDMTAAELLGKVAEDGVKALQAGIMHGAADFTAAQVREHRAAVAAAKAEEKHSSDAVHEPEQQTDSADEASPQPVEEVTTAELDPDDVLVSPPPAAELPDVSDDRLFSSDEIDDLVAGMDHDAAPLGKGLEHFTHVSLDIDEPIAVGGPNKGAWDSAANKRFLERKTNQRTKHDLPEFAPSPPPKQISLQAAEALGDAAFKAAAREMLIRNFSEVNELAAVTQQARGAMKNVNRPTDELRDAINKSIRGRIENCSGPEATLVNKALRAVGVNPDGLTTGQNLKVP